MNSVRVHLSGSSEKTSHPTVSVSTMGCKVNTFESAQIEESLAGHGLQRAVWEADADIRIVNTCTVTLEADRQARQQVRRIIRQNPEAWVVVTGCYAQSHPEACESIPGVDLVVGNARKLEIPALLKPMMQRQLPRVIVDEMDAEIGLPDQLIGGFEGRTRAFVQVQQGCDRGCTFCIIHKARGPNRSFDTEMIRRQVERLVLNGYREVVLCGVDIGSYGEDVPARGGIEDLLELLLGMPLQFRIRLSSIDPAHLSDRLISLMAGHRDRLCPHLHLSMQSGNTLILKRMRRRATREILLERVSALREAIPDVVLSADVLVGFPTESDEHFADTLTAVEVLNIAFPHVFTYSKRPGTPAARIPSQLPRAVKRERAERVRALGKQVWRKQARGMLGRKLPVLVEKYGGGDDGSVTGRADNYFTVRLSADAATEDWQEIEITGVEDGVLVAR